MKNACILMSLILTASVSALGQSIADQLRIAECSFFFYDGPTELKVLDQMVTKRSVKSSNSGLIAYGSAYHIEVVYKGDELKLDSARIEFLDKDKRPLHAIQVEDGSRYMKVNTLGQRPRPKAHFIAISLEGIPLRLLDDVVSIRIAK